MSEIEFRHIFEEYRMRLFYFAKKYVSREYAEDVVSEVFLNMWKHSPTFESDDKVRAWLMLATRNKCRDKLKSLKRKHTVDIDIDEIDLELWENDISIIEFKVLNFLYKEIEKLGPSNKRIFNLFLETNSIAEVAKILDLKPQTVSNQVYTIRKNLKEKIETII